MITSAPGSRLPASPDFVQPSGSAQRGFQGPYPFLLREKRNPKNKIYFKPVDNVNWGRDVKQNDIQHNDINHDTQLSQMLQFLIAGLCSIMLNVITKSDNMLNVEAPMSKLHRKKVL